MFILELASQALAAPPLIDNTIYEAACLRDCVAHLAAMWAGPVRVRRESSLPVPARVIRETHLANRLAALSPKKV
jgi:hypothetical protein